MKIGVDFNYSGTWTYLEETYMSVHDLAEFENDISLYSGDIERLRLWITDSNLTTIKLFVVEVADVLDNVSSRLAVNFEWKVYFDEPGIDELSFHEFHSNRVITMSDSGEDDGSLIVDSYSRQGDYYTCISGDAVLDIVQMSTAALTVEAFDGTKPPIGIIKRKGTTTSCEIISQGILGGFSSLTIGGTYYADPSTANVTVTKPTAPDPAYKVGVALTTTIILVNISQVDEN